MLLYRMTLRHHLQISRRIHSRVILAKLKYTMTTILKQLPLLPEFKKFIIASKSGRRVMPSGKKIRPGTIEQYECVYKLLQQYQLSQHQPMRITLLHRSSLRTIRKEKNYWSRFFKNFAAFLYKQKQCFDFYVQGVFKIIRTFFNYLSLEKSQPVGEFHKQFRIPAETLSPIILSPAQLRFLITDRAFEESLPISLQRTKDIFVFGCTVALRHQDLMGLKKEHIRFSGQSACLVLHTQKTGAAVNIPLPAYAMHIYNKYNKQAGRYVLPRLSGSNLNLQIKELIMRAGWNHILPKIRHRQGVPVEIKNNRKESMRFYEQITVHTMRRTAITTLLLLGVDESSVRRISGHAAGSKEFYKYVGLVQDILNEKVKAAHEKLLEA